MCFFVCFCCGFLIRSSRDCRPTCIYTESLICCSNQKPFPTFIPLDVMTGDRTGSVCPQEIRTPQNKNTSTKHTLNTEHLTFVGARQVLCAAASLLDDASSLGGLALLLLLQLLGGLLTQQQLCTVVVVGLTSCRPLALPCEWGEGRPWALLRWYLHAASSCARAS